MAAGQTPEVTSSTSDNRPTKVKKVIPSSIKKALLRAPPPYRPRALTGIPFTIRVGTKYVPIGFIRIEIRPCQQKHLDSLIQFWKQITTSSNICAAFPSTQPDTTVIVSTAHRGIQSGLSFEAEALYNLGSGAKMKKSICGCLLASKLTKQQFTDCVSQNYSFIYPHEWTLTWSLFTPVTVILEKLFDDIGDALFINVLMIDVNVTQSNNPKVSLTIYQEIFQKTMRAALEKGLKLALFIAKDKNEMSIFRSLGFYVLNQIQLDAFNEITLMVWYSRTLVNAGFGNPVIGPVYP